MGEKHEKALRAAMLCLFGLFRKEEMENHLKS